MLRILARTASNSLMRNIKPNGAINILSQPSKTLVAHCSSGYFRQFSILSCLTSTNNGSALLGKSTTMSNSLVQPKISQSFPLQEQTRSVTKFSLRKGKRKSIKAVIKRFYRLNWGIWIRTRTGRHKKMWKKSASRRAKLRQHVFVNGSQSWFLDKCVTKFWRKPKYYVDDIYEPYHERPEFFVTKNTKIVK
uniref:Large ribosomal subunit protein bL35m n=1 Tax=Culicoides sonorensis TaxID=179676 RepID=A0A336MA23_CULSO